jgi:endonuclease-3
MIKIQEFDKIFKLLRHESRDWYNPFLSSQETLKKTPFTTLISCILSLRTKDDVTAKASLRLLKEHNTPEKLLKLPVEKIEQLIYPVGFFRNKSKSIKEICEILIRDYKGEVPKTIDELVELPGVGRKTANIVMVFGFGSKEHIPVDIHCHRIPNRLGWIKTKTPDDSEKALLKILPKKFWEPFNDLFVRFGQNLCVPVSPFCSKCPIYKYCKRVGVEKSR